MLEIDDDYRKAISKTVNNFVKNIPKEVDNIDIQVIGNTLQVRYIPKIEKIIKE